MKIGYDMHCECADVSDGSLPLGPCFALEQEAAKRDADLEQQMLALNNNPAALPAPDPPPPSPPPPGPGLPATLLYSRVSRNILCMEASKDLVDLVVGFLTLPLGCVVKLLHAVEAAPTPAVGSRKHEEKPLVGITHLFDCTEKMEDARLCSSKSLLVDPRPTMTFGGKIITIPGTEGANIYCCGAPAACEFITKRPDLKCPKHKRKMENPCKVLADEAAVTAAAAAAGGKGKEEAADAGKKGKKGAATAPPPAAAPAGYIKGDTTFMITNTLEVFPSSTIQSILRLGTAKGEKMSDLESMEISVASEEIVQLLKASLSSTNVLNDVFGKYCKKSLAAATTPALPGALP